MPTALIVDESSAGAHRLASWLVERGVETTIVQSVADARKRVAVERFDLVLVELVLPDGSGLDVVSTLEPVADTEVVLIAEHAAAETAIEAFRGGATDFLSRPIEPARLERIVARVVRMAALRDEIDALRSMLRGIGHFDALIGASLDSPTVFAEEAAPMAFADFVPPVGASIAEVEKALVLATLEHFEGGLQEAAAVLGVSVETLSDRLERYAEGEGGA